MKRDHSGTTAGSRMALDWLGGGGGVNVDPIIDFS